MMMSLIGVWSVLMAGNTGAEATPSVGLWMALLAVLVLSVYFFWSSKRRWTALNGELELQLSQEKERARALEGDKKKQSKDLESKREEIQKSKKDIASLRKKNHAGQEELKSLKERLETAEKKVAANHQERPAYTPSSEKAQAPVETAAAAKPAASVQGQATPDQEALVAGLRVDLDALRTDLKEARKEISSLKNENKKSRRQVENYRRIDVATKSKFETLEDQLNHMGRKYYDAVSELAKLKGEVPAVSAAQATSDVPAAEVVAEDDQAAGEQASV